MLVTLHDILNSSANSYTDAVAISDGKRQLSYRQLQEYSARVTNGFLSQGVARVDRIALYLPKRIEYAVAVMAVSMAGGIFVPVNPVLKSDQVLHILKDSGAKFLVTTTSRLSALSAILPHLPNLNIIVVSDTDGSPDSSPPAMVARTARWEEFDANSGLARPALNESDTAAIFYTSGSTGNPKGVVLSHRNLVVGAQSVASYLENDARDVILAMLPLSFDAGFSQLTTGLLSGAHVALLDFLLPSDVVNACEKLKVTGLTGVPPLWMQLVEKAWPDSARQQLRYFANTGGKMPRETLDLLRKLFPNAKPFLMYGLTEAFRSTFLPPDQVDTRPDSIGKAIPNAEILVVDDSGNLCGPGEIGELVHAGPLVSQGYWNDLEKTKVRFKEIPGRLAELPLQGYAVWSGDSVTYDKDGFLYFVGRRDDMIKSSGYRVSPTEIEEVAFGSGLVSESAAIGVPHKTLGQAIVLVAKPVAANNDDTQTLLATYQKKLPAFMVPKKIIWQAELPRNPNGKIDRRSLATEYRLLFSNE